MKIKLPEILAALFLCLSDINPQISVYGLSERNYYNDVLYRQKHGSTHNTPRYQIKSIISRNPLDPSDSDIDHTTHSEAYLHDQRNSTVTKFREYRTPNNNKTKIRGRRYQDKSPEKNEPSFKAIIGYEKQSLNLEINGVSPAFSSADDLLKTTADLELKPAALVYKRSTAHQTGKHATEKLSTKTKRVTRLDSRYNDVIAAARRLLSTSSIMSPEPTTSSPLRPNAAPPAVASREELALAPPKEQIIWKPDPLDTIAFATIRSLLKKFKRMRGNGTMDDAVSVLTDLTTDTQLKSNFTTPTTRDQHEVSPTDSASQENRTEESYDDADNSEFTSMSTDITEQVVNSTSPGLLV